MEATRLRAVTLGYENCLFSDEITGDLGCQRGDLNFIVLSSRTLGEARGQPRSVLTPVPGLSQRMDGGSG